MKRLMHSVVLVAFVMSCMLGVFGPQPVKADPPTWMDMAQNPTLDAVWTVSDQVFNESNALDFEPTCENRTITTRPARPGQTQQTVNRCWYTTAIGLVQQGGGTTTYAVEKGKNIAGGIIGRSSAAYFSPTPKPNVLLDVKSGSSSNYIKFHFDPTLTPTVASNGTVSHAFAAADTLTLTYQSGAAVTASIQHLNYSENGNFATIVLNGVMLRINLQTKQILHFGAPAPLGPGHNPRTQAAISNDGTYAVATVTNINDGNRWMRVYDLQNCQGAAQSYITSTHANCPYRDLKNFLTTNIPNFNYYTMAKFVDNNTLTFYHRNTATPPLYTQFTLRAPNVTAPGMKYLALGDSFASGEGAFSYQAGTDIGPYDNNCHLSTVSYPYLIDTELTTVDWFRSMACSGARIVNVVGGNGVRTLSGFFNDPYKDNQYAPPIDYESNYAAHEWTPGFAKQIQRVEEAKPNVMTLSIAGNDLGFVDKLKKCLGADTCFSTYEERKQLAQEINRTFYTSANTFKRLKAAAAPGAKLYVIGYPQIVSPLSNCANNVPQGRLNANERELFNLTVSRLNLVIKQAAENAGASYVDAENAFAGKRLCESTTSGDVAVNGVTAGDDVGIASIEVVGNESFHPNRLGHQMLRDTIISQTSGFTLANPLPDPTKTIPEISDSMPLIAGLSPSSGTVRLPAIDGINSQEMMIREQIFEVDVQGYASSLKTGTPYQVELHSTPVPLGTFTSDESGNLSISATIPASVPTGFHTLHIYGPDMNGQQVDVYKPIYVAASETDWDGDGITNDLEPCAIFEPANVDADLDGIDDACDPAIEV